MAQLTAAGIRVKLDADESQTPGWKFAEYEMRGVPLRLEIGPKDIEKSIDDNIDRMKKSKDALEKGGEGWHELEAEDGTIALDLSKVVFVQVDAGEQRVGFGL